MEMLQLTAFVVLLVCSVFGRSLIKETEQQDRDGASKQIVLQRVKRGDVTGLLRVKRTDIFELPNDQHYAAEVGDVDNSMSRPRRSIQDNPKVENLAEKSAIQRKKLADPIVLSRVKDYVFSTIENIHENVVM